MKHFFLFAAGGRSWARVALLLGIVLVGLGLRPGTARASHLRAGDIQAKSDTTIAHNPRRIFFKMILYTDVVGVRQDSVTIFFGDGTSSCYNAIPRVGNPRPIPGNTDTYVNIYTFEHTFTAAGGYNISFIGENRNRGVLNMTGSDNQSFYISTYIYIDPTLGLNHSVILTTPAIDRAASGQVYTHNPGAHDADGDLLVYHLRPSQKVDALAVNIVGAPCARATGNNVVRPVVVPNFRYPNDPAFTSGPGQIPVQVPYGGIPVGIPGRPAIFVQDSVSGQITWNAPLAVGIYNVAMEVREYRRTPGGNFLVGLVIRDMQIIVTATNNLRPTITIPADICVVAGRLVTGTVTAVDNIGAGSTAQTPVSLFAYSGIKPPATFVQTATGPPVASGVFNWQTQCNNVADLPYLVVFKAQDSPNPVTTTNPVLFDEQVWRITVVGPPPQNLRAVADASTGLNRTLLNWDAYNCTNASRIYIYRKENSGAAPGACVTGIPASTGYVRIGSVAATATSFTDNNTSASGVNQGLDRGKTYCYRIYAEFPLPAGGASLASDEACALFAGRAAQLTNVDVEETSTTTGRITVRWTQPRAAAGTTLDGAPSYVLSRGEGLTPTVFTTVRTATTLADTSFLDTGLDTQNRQYTYRLAFVRTFSNGTAPVTETAALASSVRVTVQPNNPPTSFTVSWNYNVPWDNSSQPTIVYRLIGGTFTQVGTATSGATSGTFVDRDPALVRGQTYCYYVRTEGRYAPTGFLSSLLNRSQVQCAALISPPCAPILTLEPTNCDSVASLQEFPGLNQRYTNRLRWRTGTLPTGCDATVTSYRVYYRPTATGAFTLLGTTTQTSYLHGNLTFSGGCYRVQAVAPSGILSDSSNVACQDNCLFFKLPNIFTPNGDGPNDTFRPKNNSPIRSIHFKAFNRWGVKVFENTTTANDRILINWTGGGPVGELNTSTKVSDGIYYYLAEVEFADFANTKRTYKGWVEIVR